ncbi:MAG: hypothetical protein IID40_08025 [Planctomycetes bacterium]|nr:hypothetical protein [Planctomycetota bacterium]
MATTIRQLDIRRIYTSRSAGFAPAVTEAKSGARFSVLGVLTLLLAGSWIYLAWWPADRLLGRNLIQAGLVHFPMVGGLGALLGLAPADLANPAPPEGTEAMVLPDEMGPPSDDAARQASQAQGVRAMKVLTAIMESWLALATLTGCWLAMCAGAAINSAPIAAAEKQRPILMGAVLIGLAAVWLGYRLWQAHRIIALGDSNAAATGTGTEIAFVTLVLIAVWLSVAALTPRGVGAVAAVLTLLLIGGGALIWIKLETLYPSVAPRLAAVLGTAIAVLVGALAGRRLIGLFRVGVVLAVVAAIVSVAGLALANAFGGVHTHELTATTYALVAAVPVAYAVVLLGARAVGLR